MPATPGLQLRVLALRHAGDRDDALLQAVEIDLHGDRRARRARRLRAGLVAASAAPPRLAATAAAAAVRRRRRAADAAVFVALRQQRARLALLQHREIQPEVLLVVVRRHVEPLRLQAEIGRREEPQILAARVPRRPHRVGEAVGDLLRLAGLDVADEDRVVERVQMARVRDPLRVGAPRPDSACAAGTIHGSLPTIFALPLATSSTQTFRLVSRVEDLLRVGRPRRRVVVRRIRQRDLARRREAVLRLDARACTRPTCR